MDTSIEIASHFNYKYSLNIDRSTVSKKKDRWINQVNVIRHHDPFLEKTMTCRVEQIMGRGVILTELLILRRKLKICLISLCTYVYGHKLTLNK